MDIVIRMWMRLEPVSIITIGIPLKKEATLFWHEELDKTANFVDEILKDEKKSISFQVKQRLN